MRKNILTFLFCAFSIVCYGQVNFALTSDGNYRTVEGENFVVVDFEGMSAHDIFTLLQTNVTSIYNDASKVMNTVQDASIKVRGFSKELLPLKKVLGFTNYFEGYYQLEFKIKDGRVRVSAPYIEDDMYLVTSDGKKTQVSFAYNAKKLFKNGEPKDKEGEHIAYMQTYLNNIINRILAQSSQVEEDW